MDVTVKVSKVIHSSKDFTLQEVECTHVKVSRKIEGNISYQMTLLQISKVEGIEGIEKRKEV